MPELPELENYKNTLATLLAKEEITGCRVFAPTNVSQQAQLLVQSSRHITIETIARYGKELFFDCGKGWLCVHLMLCGEFYFSSINDEKLRYKLFALDFASNNSLYVCDFKRLAKISACAAIEHSVPDALDEAFTLQYLQQCFAKRSKAVKAMLQDQTFVKGIGNAYADEILWLAGIHPLSHCNKLPEAQIQALYNAVKEVLNNAIATIARLKGNIIRGEERSFLLIHNPKKKYSPSGGEIKVKEGASRTYYTDEQKLYL